MGYSKGEGVAIRVVEHDALTFRADVLALKYAQEHYGVDAAVAQRLDARYPNLIELMPKVNDHRFLDAGGTVGAGAVLFVGVSRIWHFEYSTIREFSQRVLRILSNLAPETGHLAMTLHGAGFGLDEREAFESEIAGLSDAITTGEFPPRLETITILERNPGRAYRLQKNLDQLLPNGRIPVYSTPGEPFTSVLQSAANSALSKPYVFVAMPFAEDMDDVFHYGISNAVNGAGFLCERADQSSFTGDVLEWVKHRIASASLVVADLSNASPNVYLEVGYAWGCGKPTVLLVRQTEHLKFDVRGQRCLVYKSIKSLEEMLKKELVSLPAQAASSARWG